MCHSNNPIPLSQNAQLSWKQDPTTKSRAKIAESLLTVLDKTIGDNVLTRSKGNTPNLDTLPRTSRNVNSSALGPPPGRPVPVLQTPAAHAPAHAPGASAAGAHDPPALVATYVRPGMPRHDAALRAATSWTCFGGYRP